MNKYIKYYFITALVVMLSACTENFDELNTNPNAPTGDQASAELLLTNTVESLADRVFEIGLGHEIGSGWVQHMAKVQYTDEDRYLFRVGTLNNAWSSFYAANGQDAETIYKIAVKEGHENYQGVALVLKSYIISVTTDLFGNVPYSEAFKGDVADGGILSPKYDSQESIYRSLIASLEEANSLLDEHGEEIAGDILFDNDIALWKKFANSLRLRLLLRMSARDEAFATTEMTKMVGNDAYPIFEAGENAQLNYLGSAPNNNPVNENRKTRDDHRVSKTIVDLLIDLGDPRLEVYAQPAATGAYVGLPNGLTSADAAKYNGNGLANTSKLGNYFTAAETPGVLMSYAELQFILAEAAHRNYIPGGDVDAEAYYNAGIEGSMEQYRAYFEEEIGYETEELTEAIEDYVANNPYDAANAIESIAIQKYIALFDQGLQAWFEWRRLDYPVLTPAAAGVNGGKIPVRVPYPLDETTRNAANLSDAISSQGADNLNTHVWWDIN